ncbi:MAG: ROK family protein [Planctomycetota bacterium]
MSARHYGIDIGGTKIGVCFGDEDGNLLATDRLDTDPAATPDVLLRQAWELLNRAASEVEGEGARAVGIACPGPMSSKEGRFLDPPNMPTWHGFEVQRFIEELSGLPVALMNDANASVLAEVAWGGAQGTRNAIFLTMSTGMGAGLYLNGDVFEGPDDLAGEIGHLRLDANGPVGFGKAGSVEGYLSGPGMTQVARNELLAATQRGERSKLHDHETVGPPELFAAAREDDPVALRAVDRIGEALGRLMSILTDLFNPEVIVLGTIGTAQYDLLVPRARRVLEAEAIPRAVERMRIEPSPLGEKRGHLTALAIAKRLREQGGAKRP